jgi:RNA polymerase sporulation-specific sigma factor
MRVNKVEICGVDTSSLVTLSESEKRELLRLCAAGDEDARGRLVMGNLRLVLSVIGRFNPKGESIDDLFQVGCIGLIKAIDNFNLDLDVRFSTYAVPMIIGEIRRYQRDNNAVRVSRGTRDLAYRALQAKEEISRVKQRDATLGEIAEALEVTERAVSEAMEAISQPISIYDAVYGDGEDSVYVIDKLADEGESDESWVENLSLKEAMRRLSPREMNIIERRFYKGRTQMEIAAEIGISQAQVSRLEKAAVDKLRKYMA